eukprot:1628-Heterococcus_DN1.PRE.2
MVTPLTEAEKVAWREKIIHFALRGYREDARQLCISNERDELEAQRILDLDRQFTAELSRLQGLCDSAASVHSQAHASSERSGGSTAVAAAGST